MRAIPWTVFLFLALPLTQLYATNWPVGPGQTYIKPSQVANLVAAGDTVTIAAGEYPGDVAFWKADGLFLRGEGGFAHLNADGKAAGQKAIWVIQGDDITVEQIEFSHCTVADKNGAGIRQEGINLTVRKCWFHDNENGILAGNNETSTILVEHTEFGFNGYGDGFSHNIYVNHVAKLIFRYNYSHDSKIGHLVKSRAHENHILYNRLDSQQGSGVSYEIDLPNGGLSFVIGNQVLQPADGQNSAMMSFGLEGLSNPGPHECYAINNTMINAKTVGRFFNLNASTAIFKGWNNLLVGGGDFSNGPVQVMDTIRNLRIPDPMDAGFEDLSGMNLHIMLGSPAVDQGLDPEYVGTVNLYPAYEYDHPAGYTDRPEHGLLDVGAYEGPLLNTILPDAGRSSIQLWRMGPQLGVTGLKEGDIFQVWSINGALLGTWLTPSFHLPEYPVIICVLRKGNPLVSRLLP